jgi:hypothetical protein
LLASQIGLCERQAGTRSFHLGLERGGLTAFDDGERFAASHVLSEIPDQSDDFPADGSGHDLHTLGIAFDGSRERDRARAAAGGKRDLNSRRGDLLGRESDQTLLARVAFFLFRLLLLGGLATASGHDQCEHEGRDGPLREVHRLSP